MMTKWAVMHDRLMVFVDKAFAYEGATPQQRRRLLSDLEDAWESLKYRGDRAMDAEAGNAGMEETS